MTQNHLTLLDSLIMTRKQELAPEQTEMDFFEYFSANEILKNEDLTIEEIENSITDGPRDGGIDSLFLFIDDEFINLDNEELGTVKPKSQFRIVMTQASITKSFEEKKVIVINDTLKDLFDFGKSIEDLEKLYKADLCCKVEQIRKLYIENSSKFPSLEITFYYITKSIEKVHDNVLDQAQKGEKNFEELIGNDCKFSFRFISASDLWLIASKSDTRSFSLTIEGSTSTSDRDLVGFVEISDYYNFITNESGNLLKNIFEANVRDYQGNVEVNRSIEMTLEEEQSNENFWWLNNGITIICTQFRMTGKKLTIEGPQIVNGLQTSNQIYQFFSKKRSHATANRHVLIRVINPENSLSRDRIIKATNSQTAMVPGQLRATDQIHKDIEVYFDQNGMFYDRRKSYHRNQKRPLSKIIGISALSQAVHAILNLKPHESRAKPASLIKDAKTYDLIFNGKYNLRMYYNVAKIIKNIESFMKSEKCEAFSKELKYHLATVSVCRLLGKQKLNEKDLSFETDQQITETDLLNCIKDIDDAIKKAKNDETPYNTFVKRTESTEVVLKLLQDLPY